MRRVAKIIAALLIAGLGISAQGATLYPSPKNEVITRTFVYHQSAEIGLFGSSSTTWYRATAADPKGSWPNAIQSSGTTLLCQSSSSPQYGACPNSSSNGSNGGERDIPLAFIEQRSGLIFTLNVRAVKSQSFSAPPCDKAFPELLMDISARGVVNERCDGNARDAASFKVYLPAMEINRLPVGGKWVATLNMRLVTRNNDEFAHVAQITLNINDAGRHDIFFPEYSTGTPLIDLNFNKVGSGVGLILSGQKAIDMCLYDGYSLYSSGFIMSFNGSETSGFNLLRVNGSDNVEDKIEMHLRYYSTPEGWRQVTPNANLEVKTNGPYNQVTLPGSQYPVVCKDTQLEITVAPFLAIKKNAGTYRGTITVSLILK